MQATHVVKMLPRRSIRPLALNFFKTPPFTVHHRSQFPIGQGTTRPRLMSMASRSTPRFPKHSIQHIPWKHIDGQMNVFCELSGLPWTQQFNMLIWCSHKLSARGSWLIFHFDLARKFNASHSTKTKSKWFCKLDIQVYVFKFLFGDWFQVWC